MREINVLKTLTLAVLATLAVQGPAHADEFTDVIDSALAAYADGDIAGASEDLDYATKILAEKRSSALSGFLPEALPGWEREDADGEGMGMGMAMFGGGTSAAATYSNADGDITITLVTDSPMVASLGAMFSGLSAAAGAKPLRIQRVQFVDNDGELQGIIDNRILVTVGGSASIESKKAYLEAMDFNAIKDY